MEETPEACGTAGFEFISELPGFILYVRCFLKKQAKEVILLHDSLSPESFSGLGWRGEAVLGGPPTAFCLCFALPVPHPLVMHHQQLTKSARVHKKALHAAWHCPQSSCAHKTAACAKQRCMQNSNAKAVTLHTEQRGHLQ